jgi:hypothetical protein
MYVNMTGRDISVVIKRENGDHELEFYPSSGKIPKKYLVSESQPAYDEEYGMMISSTIKQPILDILNIMGLLSSSHISCQSCENTGSIKTGVKCSYDIIAFIVDEKHYQKIDWTIPDSMLAGKRKWIFSPGKEITGADAICGHSVYYSFNSYK